MNKIEITKRLYATYTKKYLKNIFIAFFFSILLAGSTSSVAYLLDPAIKKLFIEQNQSLILIIPFAIIDLFPSLLPTSISYPTIFVITFP